MSATTANVNSLPMRTLLLVLPVLAPGIYRLVFMGASGKRKATREFNL